MQYLNCVRKYAKMFFRINLFSQKIVLAAFNAHFLTNAQFETVYFALLHLKLPEDLLLSHWPREITFLLGCLTEVHFFTKSLQKVPSSDARCSRTLDPLT